MGIPRRIMFPIDTDFDFDSDFDTPSAVIWSPPGGAVAVLWTICTLAFHAGLRFPSIPIPIATPTPILFRHLSFPSGSGKPPAESAVAFSTSLSGWVSSMLCSLLFFGGGSHIVSVDQGSC